MQRRIGRIDQRAHGGFGRLGAGKRGAVDLRQVLGHGALPVAGSTGDDQVPRRSMLTLIAGTGDGGAQNLIAPIQDAA